jgi:hypothetical protein
MSLAFLVFCDVSDRDDVANFEAEVVPNIVGRINLTARMEREKAPAIALNLPAMRLPGPGQYRLVIHSEGRVHFEGGFNVQQAPPAH